ncbi:D-malate degradation protein R [Achromobacter xylosoxidans]|jgi:DNA-binding transcriptional LysR family regulator|uniref:LysR family transcriptional regulator n=1 Tax=Alcaligenes xylosoxydans xylosoxydans TaxID=85698 RepID=UPI0006C61349|nr:LysR family transcriptional regulator [Achromobacter xylosoxidans]CUJ59456.1 D-malate degradation protein R [Achromobacter xylosoxidans]
MDTLQAMKTFTAVVEAGSFVGAMGLTSLSKAAVSRHIGELEQHLGTRLIQRTTRRLSITSEGQIYYQRAKEILAAIEQAEAEVGFSSQQAQGALRVTAPYSFGVMHLSPLWGRFSAQHPLVTLDLVLSDQVVDIVEEGFDLAVRIARLPDSTLVSRLLARTRMVMCASPVYLADHGALTKPADLLRHDVISYSYWSSGETWSFQGPDGESTVHVHSRIQANNGETCRAAAMAHRGIVLLPDCMIYEDLKEGRLVEIMPEYRSVELGIYAVYPTRKQLPLKVRRLVDLLVQEFQSPIWETPRKGRASRTASR